jgi:hypothetical protein
MATIVPYQQRTSSVVGAPDTRRGTLRVDSSNPLAGVAQGIEKYRQHEARVEVGEAQKRLAEARAKATVALTELDLNTPLGAPDYSEKAQQIVADSIGDGGFDSREAQQTWNLGSATLGSQMFAAIGQTNATRQGKYAVANFNSTIAAHKVTVGNDPEQLASVLASLKFDSENNEGVTGALPGSQRTELARAGMEDVSLAAVGSLLVSNPHRALQLLQSDDLDGIVPQEKINALTDKAKSDVLSADIKSQGAMMLGYYGKAYRGGLNDDDLANIDQLVVRELLPASTAASLKNRDRVAKQKVQNNYLEKEVREGARANAKTLALAGDAGDIKDVSVVIGDKTITLTAKALQQGAADDVWAHVTQIYSTPQEQIEAFSATGLSYVPDVLKRQATAATNQLRGHAAKLQLGEVDEPGEKDTAAYFGENVSEFYSWFRSASEGGSATTLRRLFDSQAEFDIYQDSLFAEQYGGVTEATALKNSFAVHSKKANNPPTTDLPFTADNTTNVLKNLDGYEPGKMINEVVASAAVRFLADRAYTLGAPANSLEDIVAKKLEGRFAIINDAFVPTNGNQVNPDILGALEYKLEKWTEENKGTIGGSKMTFVPVIDKSDQWMIVSVDTLDQRSESRYIFGRDEMLAEYKAHRGEERVAENKRQTKQKALQESIDGQGKYVPPRYRSGQGKLVPRVNDPEYDKDIADRIAKDLEENEKNRTDSRGRAVPPRAPGT